MRPKQNFMSSNWKRFSIWSDEDGSAMIYVSVIAAALFGFAALAVDFSTSYTTHTQARAAAEAAALAAASQLDGNSDSITRATNAAQATPLVSNAQNFAQGAAQISVASLRFLTGLPAGNPGFPEDPTVLDSFVTADPFEARFVEVTTQQLTKNNFFITAVGGTATAAHTGRAVAGFTQVLCKIAPLAVCNPAEANTIGAPFDIAQWKGHQVLVKAQGPTSAWTPGDFGLVDIDGTQSVPQIRDALASSEPEVCVSALIDVKPGQTEGARNAFNTRFDMYENPGFGGAAARSNPKYRPARNVTKGMVRTGGVCSSPELPQAGARSMAMPRDTNISVTQRFGNGTWDCLTYWNTMHPGVAAPAGCSNASTPATMSRFQLYRHEIDSANLADHTGATPLGENQAPVCHADSATTTDTPDRRVIFFAVINCLEHGPISGNSAGPIPVEAFVKAFMTEPTGSPPNIDTYLEVVDVTRPGADDGVLHDIVQLYR